MEQNGARLSLVPTRARQRMLDGAWWPRSYESEPELSALIMAMNAGTDSVTRIGLRRGAWLSAPALLTVNGRVVRLDWHGPQDIYSISVTTDGPRRLDILLVPPSATSATVRTAMSTTRDSTTAGVPWPGMVDYR